MKRVALIFIAIIFVVVSCKKIEEYPDTPQITGITYSIKDTVDVLDNHVKKLILELSVIDGDGDLGLFDSDTVSPGDTSKVYIYQYNRINGIYVPEEVEENRFYRIPFSQPAGQNKTLKCRILIDMEYQVMDNFSDTLKYECFIIDRAWHKSNVITSPEIVIDK